MKIAAVAFRAPSRRYTNQDLIERIEQHNAEVPRCKKATYLRLVEKLLSSCGAETRHWREIDKGEKARDLIVGAMDDALADANMQPADIDLLIYCGVGKGFLEPANAYFYAKARGMRTVNCFDVTDACMSWIRALQIAYQMLRAGAFKTVMIINGEFHPELHGKWKIGSVRALEHTFPKYTIGEAASATILVPSDDEWRFDYDSRPELADLCTLPLEGYADFVEPSERLGLNGVSGFVSFGRELFQEGQRLLGNLARKSIADLSSKTWYFPHAASKSLYQTIAPRYGVAPEKLYLQVFPRFGNLVSASIPTGLSLAQTQGKLKRGDPIALLPASAGLVASVVQFTF
jgi:acyl-CoA:acyl-CoA alkyltransferase